MANNTHFIKRITLKDISDAIKIYHIRRSNLIQGTIPVHELAEVLRDGVVTTSAPEATYNIYKTDIQTYKDVADVVRSLGGTTELIKVKDLEERIIDLKEQLSTPVISIEYVEVGDGGEIPTANKLDAPKIVLVEVSGEGGDTPESRQLDKPIIELKEALTDGGEEPPEPTQLNQPIIELRYVDESGEEPDIVVKQLSIPIIRLAEIDSDGGEEMPEPISLDAPSIELKYVTDEEEEIPPVAVQLNAPVITLREVNPDGEQPEITIRQLSRPNVRIVEIDSGSGDVIPPDFEVLRIPTISIKSAVVSDIEKPTATAKLTPPVISLVEGYAEIEGPGNAAPKLATPSVALKEVGAEEEGEEIVIAQLPKPIITIEYQSPDGEEQPPTIQKLSQPSITLVEITVFDGEPDIQKKQLDKPTIEIGYVEYTPEGDVFPESKQLSKPNITLGWQDVESGVITPVRPLTQPDVILSVRVVDNKTRAILGIAVLGETILGDY